MNLVVRRFKMFQTLKKLFRNKPPKPVAPFVDPVLGEFAFDGDLGWKTRLNIDDTEAELVLGSDGEKPSDELLQTAQMWLSHWRAEKPRILTYIRSELRQWTVEPDLPDPDRFVLQSINVLWPDKPKTCMIYLDYPGDEIRLWHVTLNGTTPIGFAYDD